MMRKLPLLILFSFIASFTYSQTYHNEWIDYGKTYYKFKVGSFGTDAVNGAVLNKGMVRVSYAAIAAAGLGNTASENFQLWRDGEEVPVYITTQLGPLSSSDYIEFWGETNNGKLDKELYRNAAYQLSDHWSLQTDTAAYFLTVNTTGPNKRIVAGTFNLANNTLSPAPYFMHTIGRYFRAEIIGGFAAAASQNLYSSSYDIGEGFTSRPIRPNNCGTQPQLPQNFFNLKPYLGIPAAPAPDMTMRISSVGNAPNSRSVRVLLNNEVVSLYQMDYFYDAAIEENIPVSKISSGTAGFVIVNESSVACDQMRVATVELTYPREFNLDNATTFDFKLNASATGHYVEINNFNYGAVAPFVYDITHGKRYVADISTAGIVKLVLEPSAEPYQLVITSQSGTNYRAINSLQARDFVDYSSSENQGDYLIISNPLIYGTGAANYVQQYSDYRSTERGGGYSAKIIDADELVDQFAWGIKKHPLSVKNFLSYARNHFSTEPKFAFLIGKGVAYNSYRNNETSALADQLNLVPTWGYPASDNILSSADFTAVPAIPIGRLSAVTSKEVGDYLQKVKQYDSAQLSPDHTVEGRSWMKNVLQIAGANDIGIGDELDKYMLKYKGIITKPSFGAKVTGFSKNSDPSGYTAAIVSFKNVYETGAALITYFGHSSSNSLDFNLDNPENYNNQSKYPVFIANGCNAGNNYEFESNRFNNKSTISEKFVLAPQRGAIGYLATTSFGVVNYLDSFTTQFYKAIAQTKYSQPIGIAIQEGIRATLISTGTLDFYSRSHAEQFAYQGDPAIKLNSPALPDYAVGEPQIEVSPSFISVADTSFLVKVKVYNLGRGENDSVTFKLKRLSPSGVETTIVSTRFKSLNVIDSVTVEVPIKGMKDNGINTLTATLDHDNEISEVTKENNSAVKEVNISEDEIRPVFPYNNAIVNTLNFKFQASTVNPLTESRQYLMEIDTTELFNSGLKKSKTVTSIGGMLEFDPELTLNNNTVYYWRVAPLLAEMHWRKASFKYEMNGPVGFEQSHYYQHSDADLQHIRIDSADRKFRYTNKTNNLFIINSIFPTSGLEDSHFSVSVNGNQIISSACDGPVLQFNVFDPITFEPWKNVTTAGVGMYSSVSSDCALSRQYNFDYLTTNITSRKKAMDFMDLIPTGSYVVVRIVVSADFNVNTYASKWQSDTATYGSGNSIYHRLKSSGFAIIDSFNKQRTFSFVYKKNDTIFAPKYAMSEGVNDRINLDVNCFSPYTVGNITSHKYGPAKAWKSVKWAGSNVEPNNDSVYLNVIGVNSIGEDTLLYRLDVNQQDFDISAVDAAKYRFIKLDLESKDDVTVTPYQLDFYKVVYDAAPEGGIAPNLYFNFPDTLVATAGRMTDVNPAQLSVAFKNGSKADFDSLAVNVILYDVYNNAFRFSQPKTRPLLAGDTLHVEALVDISDLNGWYSVYVEVNPSNQQPEQYHFNNFLYKDVYIKGLGTLPVSLINFDAALQAGDVKTQWKVTIENGVNKYEVQHSTNGSTFEPIGNVKATHSSATNSDYQFVHSNAPSGKNYYRLKVIDNDGSYKLSPVRLVTLGKGTAVNIYPNPVKTVLNVSVSKPDGKPATIKLLNAFGQQMMQKNVTGTAQVDMSAYASGLYLLQVDDGDKITTYKIQKQ